MKRGFLPVVITVEQRLRYYEALDLAHTQGDYDDFIALTAECAALGFDPYWHALGLKQHWTPQHRLVSVKPHPRRPAVLATHTARLASIIMATMPTNAVGVRIHVRRRAGCATQTVGLTGNNSCSPLDA